MTLRKKITSMLLLLLVPTVVRANISSPVRPGQLNGEPNGLQNVVITRETLTIDLRPLAEAEQALVEAIYQLHNPGGEKRLELVFAVASSNIREFEVWLDERAVSSYVAEQKQWPERWKVPAETPALDPEVKLGYQVESQLIAEQPLAFTIMLPPGPHTLKARYKSDAGRNLLGKPTVYWQFAYMLSPARDWAGFGGLDITVHLPSGWKHAITPALQREGDVLRGSFANVPADYFALTVQAPTPRSYDLLGSLLTVLFGLVVAAGGIGICWRGWNRKTSDRIYLVAGLCAALWAGLIVVTGASILIVPASLLPAKQISHYGYDDVFAYAGILALSAIALVVGSFGYLVSFRLAHRKSL